MSTRIRTREAFRLSHVWEAPLTPLLARLALLPLVAGVVSFIVFSH